MELEEMKMLWKEMSEKVEQQQLLNNKIILEMTERKYQEKINKLFYWELTATIINIIAALLLIIFYHKLDTTFLQIDGIILIMGFGLSPFLSLKKILQMKKIDVVNNSYQETIVNYTKMKKDFFNIQKFYFYITTPLMVLGLPVYLKLAYDTDLNMSPFSWACYIMFILVFLFGLSKVIKKTYGTLSDSAENILKELE